jgi:hypothetical protein
VAERVPKVVGLEILQNRFDRDGLGRIVFFVFLVLVLPLLDPFEHFWILVGHCFLDLCR